MKRKTVRMLLSMLLAAALLIPAFTACDASSDDAQPTSAPLKIMTFNVLNGWNTSDIGDRDDVTAKKILKLMPDVVGLQEFDDYYRNAKGTPLGSLISESYAEAGAEEQSWNPIFYNKSTLELLQCGHHNFAMGTSYDTYQYQGQVGSKFRTIAWALFKHKESGKQFLVCNTHLDVEESMRPAQAAELKTKVTELKEALAVTDVFLLGDLNSNVDSSTAKSLFSYGFQDTHKLAQTKDDLTSCGTKGLPVSGAYKYAIDHVYCISDHVTVSDYTTVTDMRTTSDHCPVVVTLTLD